MTPPIRIGTVLRGPRGGLREVAGFETPHGPWQPGHWAFVVWRPCSRRARARHSQERVSFTRWSARATVVAEGTGEVAPWLRTPAAVRARP